MKRSQTDAKSGIVGNNLGMAMPPFNSLVMAIPAVTITNTTARATDKAEVNLNEAARIGTLFK